MNLKTTLLLLAVAALLAALALHFGDSGEPRRRADDQMLVQGLPGGRVTRFEVLLADRQDATFERRGDQWWITSPLVDRASPDAVRMLMETLKSNPRLELAPDVDRATLEAFGLEPPTMRVTLWGTEGDPIAIRVGERDASGAYTNAVVEGDPALYRTGANLVNVLSKGRHEWRDTRFLSGDAALLRRFELKRPGVPRIVLERPGTEWELVEPSRFRANDAVVGPLVNALLLLKVDRFAVNDPQRKDLVERGITDETAVEAVLDWGARRVTARFGPPEGAMEGGRRYATDSERGHLFLVEGDALARLDTPADAFRDPRLLRVTPTNVERIRLVRPDRPAMELAFDRAARTFSLSEPFEAEVDDSRESRLRSWLLSVSALAATEYLDRRDLGPGPDGGDPFEALLEESLGTLELHVTDRAGNVRPVTIELADGGDAVFLRAAEKAPDTLYVVPKDDALEVLSIDPRELLVPRLFPDEMIRWKTATLRQGDRVRRLARDATPGAELWNDPDALDADSQDFQVVLSELAGTGVVEVLGRDPAPEDRLDATDTVVLELGIADEDGRVEPLVVRFGAIDPSGKTVVGAAGGARAPYPPRTVFRAEAWMREHLEGLLR